MEAPLLLLLLLLFARLSPSSVRMRLLLLLAEADGGRRRRQRREGDGHGRRCQWRGRWQDLSKETCRTGATRDSLPALALVGDAAARVDDCSSNVAELVRLGCCGDGARRDMVRLLLCVGKES